MAFALPGTKIVTLSTDGDFISATDKNNEEKFNVKISDITQKSAGRILSRYGSNFMAFSFQLKNGEIYNFRDDPGSPVQQWSQYLTEKGIPNAKKAVFPRKIIIFYVVFALGAIAFFVASHYAHVRK